MEVDESPTPAATTATATPSPSPTEHGEMAQQPESNYLPAAHDHYSQTIITEDSRQPPATALASPVVADPVSCSGLLEQFSKLGTTDRDVLVQRMRQVAEGLTAYDSMFFLEMNNWSLDAAICTYFDLASQGMATAASAPSAANECSQAPVPVTAPMNETIITSTVHDSSASMAVSTPGIAAHYDCSESANSNSHHPVFERTPLANDTSGPNCLSSPISSSITFETAAFSPRFPLLAESSAGHTNESNRCELHNLLPQSLQLHDESPTRAANEPRKDDVSILPSTTNTTQIGSAPRPTQNLLNMSFVEDRTVGCGEAVTPDTWFVRLWRVRNSGDRPWPVGSTLRRADDVTSNSQLHALHLQPHQPMNQLHQLQAISGSTIVRVPGADLAVRLDRHLEPGHEIDICVPMRSPSLTGSFQTQWRMYDDQGGPFGDTIALTVRVHDAGVLAVTQQMDACHA